MIDNVEKTINFYRDVIEDLTLKVLFDNYNVEDGSSLDDKQVSQAKKKIKELFYNRFPLAKQQVKLWTKDFRGNKNITYDNMTYDQKVGSRIGRQVLGMIYHKYNLIKYNKTKTSSHNGLLGKYEYMCLNYRLVPNDNMFCELTGCGKATPGNARLRLKEEGFEFENVEFEGVSFWKVISVPVKETPMEKFVSSLTHDQKEMFKALLNV